MHSLKVTPSRRVATYLSSPYTKHHQRRLAGFALAMLGLWSGLAQASAVAESTASTASSTSDRPDMTLEKVVILSRHGVRAPTKMPPLLYQVTPEQWPAWPVPLGDITPRGEHLITLMGRYYRDYWREQELLTAAATASSTASAAETDSTKGCPAAADIYVWADVDERTRKTGEAFLQGLAPDCGLSIHHQADVRKKDPLFHIQPDSTCKMDPDTALAAVQMQVGIPLGKINQAHAPALALMDKVLRFEDSAYCQLNAPQSGVCTLAATMPEKVTIGDGVKIQQHGALSLSSTLAEMFLLQQAQGMVAPGWGRIHTEAQWNKLLSLHNAAFNLAFRTPYIAAHQGSALLQTITAALNDTAGADSLGSPAAKARIVFLAGHDTNLANLSGLLGTDWTLPQQPDNTPPGGELVFERWRDSRGTPWLRVQVVYQSLAQMREQTPLTLTEPPHTVTLQLPGCQTARERAGWCQLSDFNRYVKQHIIPSCTLQALRGD